MVRVIQPQWRVYLHSTTADGFADHYVGTYPGKDAYSAIMEHLWDHGLQIRRGWDEDLEWDFTTYGYHAVRVSTSS